MRDPIALEEPYRSRAVPAGSTRYWSWLFAAREARAALLGTYALAAEWRALTDPRVETGVAHLKLAWWREEIDRWAAGSPLHPITRWLAQLPSAAPPEPSPLQRAIDATAAQIAGVPLEHAADLEPHAAALYGGPLLTAARIAGSAHGTRVVACITALAAGQYLTDAAAGYVHNARAGRICFAVDELLEAGIDNAALAADAAPPPLHAYLITLRHRAAECFSRAAAALAPDERPGLRHLLVLAALGSRHLRLNEARRWTRADLSLGDLYNAWNAARRAGPSRTPD